MKKIIATAITVSFSTLACVASDALKPESKPTTVKINGNEVTFKGQEGVVSYKATKDANNIALKIENDRITVGSMADPTLISQATAIYNEINPQLTPLSAGTTIHLTCTEGDLNIGGRSLTAGDDIFLSSPQKIQLEHTIAKANGKAEFSAAAIKSKGFFLTATKGIYFSPHNDDKTWLSSIQWLSPKSIDRSYSCCFEGELQLNKPSTNGYFLAIGANEVIFTLQKI